jgi:sialate O-acetylesterase
VKKLFPFLLAAILTACSSNSPKLNLTSLICDHMVLQQNMPVALWGTADPGVAVSAEASWGEVSKTNADENGKWKITLNTPSAGGPFTITFSAKETKLVISDVLSGEVWLCSGQSNMEMPLKGWPPNDTINNYKSEIATAEYPQIRMFTVERNLSFNPLAECKGKWVVCSPQTAGDFSATAYFFGKQLHKKLNVPVGLIQTSWGGTPAEAWTSIEYLTKVTGFEHINNQLADATKEIGKLNLWLNNLDSIDLINLPAKNSYEGIKLDDNNYSLSEYNDSSWQLMTLPCLWENAGLKAFNGVVWFRKEFEIPKNIYPEGFELYLGPVDDMDATYINGIKIGVI